ncbi:glycoside hydrolase family 99-like domain-containing protein [Gulosibacter sp. 10]|uniref:glycoside hydrolase family 99-like domain-containing protein n=1 Tax=Gulosibacter sp. 10 TaxID=1255570 RepID=UPI0020CCABBE|nr:glycoside hydrolase family 99-like domain-containing protein [Gulosibacter sp. 10]
MRRGIRILAGFGCLDDRRWLRACVEAVADRDEEHRIVIVNAWNEWAEAAVLEPTQRWGSTYLKATRAALL